MWWSDAREVLICCYGLVVVLVLLDSVWYLYYQLDNILEVRTTYIASTF
jgi:hypothetical protein